MSSYSLTVFPVTYAVFLWDFYSNPKFYNYSYLFWNMVRNAFLLENFTFFVFTIKQFWLCLGSYFTIYFCTCTCDQSTRWSKITALNSCSFVPGSGTRANTVWSPQDQLIQHHWLKTAVHLYLNLGPELTHCAPLRISWSKITDLKQLFFCTWICDQSWHNVLPSGSADQTTAWKNRSFQPYYALHFCFLRFISKPSWWQLKENSHVKKNTFEVLHRIIWSKSIREMRDYFEAKDAACVHVQLQYNTELTWYFIGI